MEVILLPVTSVFVLVNVEDKVCACYSIGNLCSEEEVRKSIIDRKLVRCGSDLLSTGLILLIGCAVLSSSRLNLT